jgi:hypothetical protein
LRTRIVWHVELLKAQPPKVGVTGDPEFEALRSAPLDGTYREWALALIVQAAVALAEGLGRLRLRRFVCGEGGGNTPAGREAAMLANVRKFILREIDRLIRAGGYMALTELVIEGEKAIRNKSAGASAVPNAPLPSVIDARPPSPQALRKGTKYIFSNGMGLSLVLKSVDPLRIGLLPSRGFESRFEEYLEIDPAGEERNLAKTVNLLALKTIVEGTGPRALETWLPDIELGRLSDPRYSGEIGVAINRGGYEGLRALTLAHTVVPAR